MTLIVGFKTGQGVIMGADSAVSDMGVGSFSGRVAEPKIWTVDVGRSQPMLMASRGRVRFGDIARYCVEYPDMQSELDAKKYLVALVVPALLSCSAMRSDSSGSARVSSAPWMSSTAA